MAWNPTMDWPRRRRQPAFETPGDEESEWDDESSDEYVTPGPTGGYVEEEWGLGYAARTPVTGAYAPYEEGAKRADDVLDVEIADVVDAVDALLALQQGSPMKAAEEEEDPVDDDWAVAEAPNIFPLGIPLEHQIVWYQKSEDVKCMLGMGVDPDARDANGVTLLMLAARRGDLQTFKVLKDAGADVKSTDAFGHTALHHAVHGYAHGVAAYILGNGNSALKREINRQGIDAPDLYGNRLLHFALENYDLRMARLLCSHGARTEFPFEDQHDSQWKSMLTLAAEMDDVQSLSYCLHLGAPVHWAPHWSGKTAFFCAAAAGSSKCVDAMLRMAPEYKMVERINDRDAQGRTPLHHAVESNCAATVDLLLRNGADPSICDHKGYNAVFTAAMSGSGSRVLAMLAKHPSLSPSPVVTSLPRETRDENGRTLLHWACMKGNAKDARMAVTHFGCDLQALDGDGMNAFHCAVVANRLETVCALYDDADLGLGAGINARDIEGKTPFMWACQKMLGPIAKALISRGAKVYLRDYGEGDALTLMETNNKADALLTEDQQFSKFRTRAMVQEEVWVQMRKILRQVRDAREAYRVAFASARARCGGGVEEPPEIPSPRLDNNWKLSYDLYGVPEAKASVVEAIKAVEAVEGVSLADLHVRAIGAGSEAESASSRDAAAMPPPPPKLPLGGVSHADSLVSAFVALERAGSMRIAAFRPGDDDDGAEDEDEVVVD